MVEVSKGLRNYFNDSKTEAAVDLLLRPKKRSSIPDDVTWNNVPDYFRALRAARQIQADYAILLHEILNAVWKPLPEPWKAKAPHEQVDDGLLDPNKIWDQGYALRAYERGNLKSELVVFVDNASGVQIGFNVLQEGKSMIAMDIPIWEVEDDDDTLWSPSGLVKIQSPLEFAPLKPFVDEAIQIIMGVGKP